MLPNNVPEKKTNPGLAIGLVFIAVGIAMMGANNMGGGVTFLILGIVFLVGQQSVQGKKKDENQSDGFPSEPQIRESQAASERKLHDEALAPDGKDSSPAPRRTPQVQEPLSKMREQSVRVDENEQRKEELKGLLESGIITKEEYRDRLKKFR